MTKEEQTISEILSLSDDKAKIAMIQLYAKQQAVEFAEWVSEKYHMTLRANGGKSVWHPRYMALDKKNDIPVEELYTLFLQSLELK